MFDPYDHYAVCCVPLMTHVSNTYSHVDRVQVTWLCHPIDSVPQVVEAACHQSNTQTNKPTKHDTHSSLRNYTKKRPIFSRFFSMFKLNNKVNTSATTAVKNWPNYIGPKREILQACPTQCMLFFPEGGVVRNLPY